MAEETRSSFEELKSQSKLNSDRPWLNDHVPKKVQEQLNELHDKHQAEIKRLEDQINKQKEESQQKKENKRGDQDFNLNKFDDHTMVNVYDFTEGDMKAGGDCKPANNPSLIFKKRSGFLSPHPPQGTWSSKTLFARKQIISPVATVLPQRQPVQAEMKACSGTVEMFQNSLSLVPERRLEYSRHLRSNSQTNQPSSPVVTEAIPSAVSAVENDIQGTGCRSWGKRCGKKRGRKARKKSAAGKKVGKENPTKNQQKVDEVEVNFVALPPTIKTSQMETQHQDVYGYCKNEEHFSSYSSAGPVKTRQDGRFANDCVLIL